jgi:thioredoxin reductase
MHSQKTKDKIKDVVIVGAGPAGITAAIQLKRSGIESVLFEGESVGGLLKNAHLVENYPGFPGGISGSDLISRFEKQLEETGVAVTLEEVTKLDYTDDRFVATTDRGETVSFAAVIASGTRPKRLADVSFLDGTEDRIHYEVHPIAGIRKKTIAIIGGGDAAFDYALTLSRKNRVFILNRSDRTRCLPLLFERVEKTKNITYLPSHPIGEVRSDGHTLLIVPDESKAGGKDILRADHVIAAIGREPRLDFLGPSLLKNLDRLTKKGRLFMVGDVINNVFRQTAIATGDGLFAAMKLSDMLRRERI